MLQKITEEEQKTSLSLSHEFSIGVFLNQMPDLSDRDNCLKHIEEFTSITGCKFEDPTAVYELLFDGFVPSPYVYDQFGLNGGEERLIGKDFAAEKDQIWGHDNWTSVVIRKEHARENVMIFIRGSILESHPCWNSFQKYRRIIEVCQIPVKADEAI